MKEITREIIDRANYHQSLPVFNIDPEERYHVGTIYINRVSLVSYVLVSVSPQGYHWQPFDITYKLQPEREIITTKREV